MIVLIVLATCRATFPLDDAYITLHNARVLLAGGIDPAYAGSSALTGATSAAHLVLIAAAGLVLPLPLASKVITIAGLLLYAGGVLALLRRLALHPTMAFALFFSALFVGYMPFQLLNGLETGLALAAMVWSLVLIDNKWLPLLCGTLPFIRPELAFLAAPLLVRRFWLDRKHLRRLSLSIFLLAITLSPWLLLYWRDTGSPLPNTGGAKIAFFAEARLGWPQRAELLSTALAGCLVGPLWLALPALTRSPRGACALVFMVLWLGSTFVVFPSGLHHNCFRYLALVVPILILGWSQLLAEQPRWAPWAVVGLILWTAVTSTVGIGKNFDERQVYALQQAAQVIQAKVPHDAVILVHDAGYVAWALPDRRLVDVVGLKSPSSAPWHRLQTAPTGSRDSAMHEIAIRAHATHLVVLQDTPPFWSGLIASLTRAGWSLTLISPVEDGEYGVYRIAPPIGTPRHADL